MEDYKTYHKTLIRLAKCVVYGAISVSILFFIFGLADVVFGHGDSKLIPLAGFGVVLFVIALLLWKLIIFLQKQFDL